MCKYASLLFTNWYVHTDNYWMSIVCVTEATHISLMWPTSLFCCGMHACLHFEVLIQCQFYKMALSFVL